MGWRDFDDTCFDYFALQVANKRWTRRVCRNHPDKKTQRIGSAGAKKVGGSSPTQPGLLT